MTVQPLNQYSVALLTKQPWGVTTVTIGDGHT